MFKLFCHSFKFGLTILGTSLLIANGNVTAQTPASGIKLEQMSNISEALPTNSTVLRSQTQTEELSNVKAESASTVLEQIDRYSNGLENQGSIGQVINVNQLKDVSPGDWAYEALRNLVERYGCIAGYPDGTYRGNRALTRYEFAAGINSCLQQIERIIAAGTTDFVSRGDLETLQRLTQEFEAELATLGTRVDNLEGRVAFLEDNQFSTNTKLFGEVIFSIQSAFGDEKADGTGDIEEIVTLSDRIRLNLDTSFTGEDVLRVRLQARNIDNPDTGTGMTALNYGGDNSNNVEVSDLFYAFPVGDNLQFLIAANDVTFDDFADPLSPYFSSSGSGALTFFGSYNALVYPSADQALAANIRLGDSISLDVGYLTREGNTPTSKNGLFDGDYTASAQLNLGLGEAIDFAFTYTHTYQPGQDVSLTEGLGTPIAENPFNSAATEPRSLWGDSKLTSFSEN